MLLGSEKDIHYQKSHGVGHHPLIEIVEEVEICSFHDLDLMMIHPLFPNFSCLTLLLSSMNLAMCITLFDVTGKKWAMLFTI